MTNRRNWCFWGGISLLLILALLPWYRNHDRLRDLYDYGLVISANGRMDRGELPYVDFTTPIQAGFLGLNWVTEWCFGKNYAGLTRGAAVLICLGVLSLPLMLLRRWPWWVAVCLGGSVVVCSASQHTILWHNALGVWCLALVTWSSAIAPVWKRSTWAWHALVMLGLVVGGVNKLNFHLIALAATWSWAIHAGFVGRASWRRVTFSMGVLLGVGAIVPLVIEMAWTGASPALWWHNVVGLAAEGRLEQLKEIFSVQFLMVPIHDYYGQLLLPQVGLWGVLLAILTVGWCWGQTRAVRRLLMLVSVGGASFAGAALLATNNEIAYVGLGAWTVLLVSVWLAMDQGSVKPRHWGVMLVPVAWLGALAWVSAWQGQRSQFGHSNSPDGSYRDLSEAGPEFGVMKGMRVPPDIFVSITQIATIMPAPRSSGLVPVFYGPGMELLDRIWPSMKLPRQPLWFHWGTSYNATWIARVRDNWTVAETFSEMLVWAVYDQWPPELGELLAANCRSTQIGPRAMRYEFSSPYKVDLRNALKSVDSLGGNVDSRILHREAHALEPRQGEGGKIFWGSRNVQGDLLVAAPTYRISGVAVLERVTEDTTIKLVANYKAMVHGAVPEDCRWSGTLELAPGEVSATLPFRFDSLGQRILLRMTQPDSQARLSAAGFRELTITQSINFGNEAPVVRDPTQPLDHNSQAAAAALFGDQSSWRPAYASSRAAQASPEGLLLAPGGEFWFHSPDLNGVVSGTITLARQAEVAPTVRLVWYKGGRIQILQQGQVSTEKPWNFRIWTAEPDGWFGFLVDDEPWRDAVIIRATQVQLTP